MTRLAEQVIVTLDGRVHLALSPDEAALLEGMDGTTEWPSEQQDLLGELDAAGFLEGSAPYREPRVVWSPAGIEVDGFDRVIAWVHRHFRWVLSRPAAVVWAVLSFGGAVALSLVWGRTGSSTLSATVTLAVLIATGWVGTMLHESAHALVLHDGGRRVGRVGMGFYWGSVCFYVDATDALFLPPRRRAVQAVAGPVADAVVAGACGLAALWAAPSAVGLLLAQIALLTWIDAAINVVPFLKLDGYWFLSDRLGRADLAEHSRRSLLTLHRRPWAPGQVRWATYALGSLVFGLALLVSGAVAWFDTFSGVIVDAWDEGWAGRVAAIAFCGPLVAGLLVGLLRPLRSWVGRLNRSGSTVSPTREFDLKGGER